jgi:bifunctional DNA-binding transcriptional regulator/antitoxin component of YhaV-PrlF toxin-antitoxin module
MEYFLTMTTTISVSPKGQVELPEEFCKRRKIKPGTSLRVTEVGNGVYVTPVPEPTEKELREVIAAAGSLARHETRADQEMVQEIIADYRVGKRRKRE